MLDHCKADWSLLVWSASSGQCVIVTLHLHKLLGGPTFDYDPLPDDRDDIGILDGGEAVGDDNGRSVGHGVVECPLDNLKDHQKECYLVYIVMLILKNRPVMSIAPAMVDLIYIISQDGDLRIGRDI